jgi:4-fold beta-flower domain-containing protein
MAEPKYAIYNKANKVVGWSKFSVMWVGKCEERLGYFHDDGMFNSSQEQVAYVKDDSVFSMEHEVLGLVKHTSYHSDSGAEFEATALVIDGVEAAKCFPKNRMVALAGIALLGERLNN